jgi:hypothetical protein
MRKASTGTELQRQARRGHLREIGRSRFHDRGLFRATSAADARPLSGAAQGPRRGKDVRITLQAGSLHILARFPNHGPDVELAEQARRHGLAPVSLSGRSLKHNAGQGLLMSFTNIREEEAAGVVTLLRQAIART